MGGSKGRAVFRITRIIISGYFHGNPLYPGDETVQLTMTGDSQEWFRQAQYDLGTAESLFGSERYPPVLFFCHLALEKSLKALYIEKYNDIPEKTHSLLLLVELLELQLPQHLVDSLLIINRLGVTGRYPHNLEKMLEQYTHVQTRKILDETKEILTWLIQPSSKR
jgi:HEPN domain-containing protein